MRMKILLSIVACSCVALAFMAAAGEPQLKTRFVPKGELTTNEVNLIIQLADKSGMKELEEVITDYMYPSTNLWIGAKENRFYTTAASQRSGRRDRDADEFHLETRPLRVVFHSFH